MYDDELETLNSEPQEEEDTRRITAEDVKGGLDGATTIASAFDSGSGKAHDIAQAGKNIGGSDLMSSAGSSGGGIASVASSGGAAGAAGGAAGGAGGGAGGGKAAAIAAGASAATGIMDKGVDKMLGDNGPEVKEGEQVAGKTTDENGNEVDDPNAPKAGDKVAPGMEVDKDGKAKQSATSRVQNVAAQGAAAYFTSGNAQAMQAAKKVSDSKTGRRLSDVVDKAPLAHQASELVDKAGVLDTAEGALDAYTNFKNGNYAEAAKGAKKAVGGTKKTKMFTLKLTLILLLILALPMLLSVAAIAAVANSFSNESDTSSEEVYLNMNDYDWPDPGIDGETLYKGGEVSIDEILAQIPDFDNLSEERKAIITAAAEVVAAGYPYVWGGHPTGPGLSGITAGGLDCAGFVMYSLWTGLGKSPGYLTTAEISNEIGTNFTEISCSEAKPGDIGLRRRGGSTQNSTNHTGIYAGNGKWLHAWCTKCGIVMGSYSEFAICLRYKGVS